MPLDPSKLQNVRSSSNGSRIAGCPACGEMGRDHTHDHLIIYADGHFGCLAFPGSDGESHRKRIWALAGNGSENGDFVPTETAPKIEIERTWDDSCLDRLIRDYSYWESRGISETTLAPFRGGIATEGQMKNRFVFPIFNSNGQIIGFDGRRVDGKPDMKWKIIGSSRKFLWGGLDEIESGGTVILTESIGDSLALREHGIPETICLFGTNMSQTVLGYLISLNPERIVVATNNDEKHSAGQLAAQKISATLCKFFNEEKIRIGVPDSAKDFGEMSGEKILEWRKKTLDTHSNPEIVE